MIISCFLDLHVLVNTIHTPSIINSSASASWLPICLPKFNPSAFVNAYVMFLPRGDAPKTPTSPPSEGEAETSTTVSESDDAASSQSLPIGIATDRLPEIGLICVSGNADFEAVRGWCETVSNVCPLFFCILPKIISASVYTECFRVASADDRYVEELRTREFERPIWYLSSNRDTF